VTSRRAAEPDFFLFKVINRMFGPLLITKKSNVKIKDNHYIRHQVNRARINQALKPRAAFLARHNDLAG
jgi:hypothetical protein